MLHLRLFPAASIVSVLCTFTSPALAKVGDSSFGEFDLRARNGERLNVVFFGASLTWGANATDPQVTSFRGILAQRLEEAYPLARFKFWDAAIGGTSSQLGIFRLKRDVLRRKPDLVFLDFSANDDINSDTPETLASYEAIVRRILLEAQAPVVQMIFPFQWNVDVGTLEGMKRRDAHLAIARAYGTAVGDAVALAQQRVKAGSITVKEIWPVDGVHPGDVGYALFADAGWTAFTRAVKEKRVCTVPTKMINAVTYLTTARVPLADLGPLPEGWSKSTPNVVSAYFDMLMSRWQDNQVVCTGKNPKRFQVYFTGRSILVYGESTPKSGKFRAYLDGKLVARLEQKDKPTISEFDGGQLARVVKGNAHLVQVIAEGLDPTVEHTLEIEPLFAEAGQELRLESICVAGGKAKVRTARAGRRPR